MQRRALRRLHLFLGCIFAPLLLFFSISGLFQTFLLHQDWKDGYQAPRLVEQLAEVHMNQRSSENAASSISFRLAVAIMSVGLILTVVLGVWLAIQSAQQPARILLYLAIGSLLPVMLLILGPHS